MTLTPQQKELILNLYSANSFTVEGKKLNREEKRDIINNEMSLNLSLGQIDQAVFYEKKKANEIDNLNTSIDSKQNYEIEGDDIVFYVKAKDQYGESITKRLAISTEKIAAMTFDYTYGGYSGPKLIKKHQIKPEVWSILKSRLNIYKDSNACPDIVLDLMEQNYGQEAVEEKIVEFSDKAVANKYGNRFIKQYDKSKERKFEKVVKAFATNESFLKYINTHLESYKPRNFKLNTPKLKNKDEVIAIFTDVHYGKEETDKIKYRIEKMVEHIKQLPQSTIHLMCLGDLVETLVDGGMHNGMIEHMDGPYGFDLIMEVVTVLENTILEIAKTKKVIFYGKNGNHERTMKNHDEDQDRLGGLVIYELMARTMRHNNIEFNYYREDYTTLDLLGFNIIAHHGDNGAVNKNPKQILWEYGNNKKHNLFVMGHMHHLNMQDVSDNAVKVICPAFAGKGQFDTKICVSGYSGFTLIENVDGFPKTSTIRLP